MSIQMLECPACRGDIEFYDEGRLFGRCTCCGREVQRVETEHVISQGERDDSNQVIRQGMDHVEMEHFETAEDLFEQYILKNPKRYEGYYGMLLVHTFNFDVDSLDEDDGDNFRTILCDMADICKTADPSTANMIQSRLDQLFAEYREYVIQKTKKALDAKTQECNRMDEAVRQGRDNQQAESVRAQILSAFEKRKNDLARRDKRIKFVEVLERHKKLLVWIISLLIFLLTELRRIRNPFGAKKTAFATYAICSICSFLLIGIPIYCLKYGSSNGGTFTPITNLLRRKRNEFASTPVSPKEQVSIVNSYDSNVRRLSSLLQEKEALQKDYEAVQKMNIEQLVDHSTAKRFFTC